jgi:hypothetical protein
MKSEFGNTLVELRRSAIVGAIFAVVTGVLFVSVAYAHERLSTLWLGLVVSSLCIGGILPLVVLPTCLFSIRVDDQHVTHLFFGRFIISQHLLSELKSVETNRRSIFPVVLRFADGSSIRFIGAHLRVIQALCHRIRELRPGFRRFH